MCDFLPPELLIEAFGHIFTTRCTRGLDALKRVCKLFKYLLSSSIFYDRCASADYPHTKNKYSKNKDVNNLRFCCTKRIDTVLKSGNYYDRIRDDVRKAIGIPKITLYYTSFVLGLGNNCVSKSLNCNDFYYKDLVDIFKLMVEHKPRRESAERFLAMVPWVIENHPRALFAKFRTTTVYL